MKGTVPQKKRYDERHERKREDRIGGSRE